ncbi:SMODS domain-containing nucleotidyltransferase [Streptomyces sp. CL12]|uniref:SMODS domain-containing nucleotidyltransferase n=1 Tax=Streptomyces sp. CL12 TaxID=3391744 RepID=UPI003A7F76F8
MAITTTAAFNEFDTKVKPSPATWAKVHERRNAVVNVIKEAFPAGNAIRYQSHKIIGSLGRNTACNPVDDIDLMVYLHVDQDLWNRRYRYNSSEFLYRVRKALNENSPVRKIGSRGQAVRFFYADGLNVDVAAVEKYTSGDCCIPDGVGGWLTTNPNKHEAYLSDRSNVLGGDLKKVIRFAKKWNKAHSSRLSSFHLEMLVARTYGTLGSNSRTALRLFFDYNMRNLSVQDPAGFSGDLSAYLNCVSKGAVNDSLKSARDRADLALTAEKRGDHREAIRLWRIVLGNDFPAYG